MKSPPGLIPAPQTSFRLDEKQGRVSGGPRRVRITSEYGLIAVLGAAAPDIQRYLSAKNAKAVRNHSGRLVAIELRSIANDHGHLGENRGNSNITTYSERLASGPLLQHKPSGSFVSPRHHQQG